TTDIVFVFVNLVSGQAQSAASDNAFMVSVDLDHDGNNDFGIKPDGLYNVKNVAALTAQRRDAWLWGTGRRGSELLASGISVRLNGVPADAAGWASAPYEPLFLKLFDVTP